MNSLGIFCLFVCFRLLRFSFFRPKYRMYISFKFYFSPFFLANKLFNFHYVIRFVPIVQIEETCARTHARSLCISLSHYRSPPTSPSSFHLHRVSTSSSNSMRSLPDATAVRDLVFGEAIWSVRWSRHFTSLIMCVVLYCWFWGFFVFHFAMHIHIAPS